MNHFSIMVSKWLINVLTMNSIKEGYPYRIEHRFSKNRHLHSDATDYIRMCPYKHEDTQYQNDCLQRGWDRDAKDGRGTSIHAPCC